MPRPTMARLAGRFARAWVVLSLLSVCVARGVDPGPSVPAARPAVLPRVLVPDGKGLAGATVTFLEYDPHASPAELVRDSITTGPDGSFRPLPPRPPAEDEGPGARYQRVMVEAPGYGITGGSIDPDDPRDVRLSAATELRVRLLTPDGKPAAGLRVAPRMLVALGPGATFPSWSVLLPAE